MSLSLQDVLQHPTLAAADPIILAGAATAGTTVVRWVHSSEVLDIAPLLRGGELLLTGGTGLATASEQRRERYVEELADRGLAALAIETGSELPGIPQSMVQVAEDRGLPLIELRSVVPFVGITQAINSMLVSESVAQLQLADQASHAMSLELAHGGGLDRILAVLAETTGTKANLVSAAGGVLATAAGVKERGLTFDPGASVITVDVPVRGVVSARLELQLPDGGDPALARVVGSRCADVLGLALLQTMPPNLKETARSELLRAISASEASWRLEQLGPAAGFSTTSPVVLLAVRAEAPQELRAALDLLLHRVTPQNASHLKDSEVIAIAALSPSAATATRAALIDALGELGAIEANGDIQASGAKAGRGLGEFRAAVGPLCSNLRSAAWSLAEARQTLDLAPSGPTFRQGGAVFDAESFGVERLAVAALSAEARTTFVRQQLGPVLDHDVQRSSQLLRTLTVWLDSGCNTARAARELHLERQSMHHRLQRIFDLCGGDPRITGRLAALHLASRLATLH